MTKKITTLSIVCLLVILWDVSTHTGQALSNGGGAPGAVNCTSCHGGALNSGSGSTSISINGDPSGYIPGQVYQVSVNVATTGRTKFGFALAADNGSGSPRGSLATGGNSNVQVVSNYITHSASGTSAIDSKTWTFNWTAPSTASGNVRFVVYGNAANGNNSESGDLIYSASKVLTAATGITSTVENELNVYPSVVTDRVTLVLRAKNEGLLSVRLVSLNGMEAARLGDKTIYGGLNHVNLAIPSNLQSGVYVMVIDVDGEQLVKRVVKQ